MSLKIVASQAFEELTAAFMLQTQAACGLPSSAILHICIPSTFAISAPAPHPPLHGNGHCQPQT